MLMVSEERSDILEASCMRPTTSWLAPLCGGTHAKAADSVATLPLVSVCVCLIDRSNNTLSDHHQLEVVSKLEGTKGQAHRFLHVFD